MSIFPQNTHVLKKYLFIIYLFKYLFIYLFY